MAFTLLSSLALYCVAIGLVQLAFLLGLGASESRRLRRAEAAADAGEVEPPHFVPAAVFAILPCLDEAAVIGDTVRALVSEEPSIRILVVDDASSDDTAVRAREAAPDHVTVLRRELPAARLGKGPALNHAFAELERQVRADGLDPASVIVLVMDADGRLSIDSVHRATQVFADPAVGGVQLGVRIRNRSDNLLTLVQDCEFWGIAALGQLGRNRTRTVSLGGNGQFTRLTALRSLGGEPWSRSLTEDLDLAVRLATGGWHLLSVDGCWVDQQGLRRLRPLVRQRTRWFQGHMTTATHRLGQVWRSPHLSNLAVLEMCSYLLIPFVIVLPWSILSQFGLITSLRQLGHSGLVVGQPGSSQWLLSLTLWYLLSFAPTIACGVIYARRERRISVIRGVLFAHVLVFWNYVLFVACWRGLFRMLRGRTSWAKTARVVESPEPATQLA